MPAAHVQTNIRHLCHRYGFTGVLVSGMVGVGLGPGVTIGVTEGVSGGRITTGK